MNSPKGRNVRKLFKILPILGLVLAGCATPTAPVEQRVLYPVGMTPNGATSAPVSRQAIPAQSVPTQPSVGAARLAVQVADIEGALARFLSPEGGELILLPNRLNVSALDYSVDSLQVIDRWLADIHKVNNLQAGSGKVGELMAMDGRGDNSVIFAGLYLGQVIRANSKLDWNWQRFDRFLAANPAFAEHYGRSAGFDTFVLVGPQGVATPINTALKRVIHGKEDSVHYIGQLLLNEVDLGKAMTGQNLFGLDRRDWNG